VRNITVVRHAARASHSVGVISGVMNARLPRFETRNIGDFVGNHLNVANDADLSTSLAMRSSEPTTTTGQRDHQEQ